MACALQQSFTALEHQKVRTSVRIHTSRLHMHPQIPTVLTMAHSCPQDLHAACTIGFSFTSHMPDRLHRIKSAAATGDHHLTLTWLHNPLFSNSSQTTTTAIPPHHNPLPNSALWPSLSLGKRQCAPHAVAWVQHTWRTVFRSFVTNSAFCTPQCQLKCHPIKLGTSTAGCPLSSSHPEQAHQPC